MTTSTTQRDVLERWYTIGLLVYDTDKDFQTYEGPRLPVELWQVILRFATLGTLNVDRVVIATDLWDHNDVWGVNEFSFHGPWTGVHHSQQRTYKTKRNICLVHSTWHTLVLPYLLECIAISHSGTLQSVLKVLNEKPERRCWIKRVEYQRRRGYFDDEESHGWVHEATLLKKLLSLCPRLRIIGGCSREAWNKYILPHPNVHQLTHIQIAGSSLFEFVNDCPDLAVRLESLYVQAWRDPIPHIHASISPIEFLNLKQLRASVSAFFSIESQSCFQIFRHLTAPSLLSLSIHYHDIIWEDALRVVERFGPTLEMLDIQTERLMIDPAPGTLERVLSACPKLTTLVLDKPNDWNWTGGVPLHPSIEVLGFSHFTIPGIATWNLLPGTTMTGPFEGCLLIHTFPGYENMLKFCIKEAFPSAKSFRVIAPGFQRRLQSGKWPEAVNYLRSLARVWAADGIRFEDCTGTLPFQDIDPSNFDPTGPSNDLPVEVALGLIREGRGY